MTLFGEKISPSHKQRKPYVGFDRQRITVFMKIQRFKDSKIQKFKNSKIQRFKDSKIQKFEYSKIQIKNEEVRRYAQGD